MMANICFFLCACKPMDVPLQIKIILPADIEYQNKIRFIQITNTANNNEQSAMVSVQFKNNTASLNQILARTNISIKNTLSTTLIIKAYDANKTLLSSARVNINMQDTKTKTNIVYLGPSQAFMEHPAPPQHNRKGAITVSSDQGAHTFLIGGVESQSEQFIKDSEYYDAQDFQFKTGPSLLVPVLQPSYAQVTINHEPYVLLAGGYTQTSQGSTQQTYSNYIQLVPLTPGSFSNVIVGTLKTARARGALIPIDDTHFLLMGGLTEKQEDTKNIENIEILDGVINTTINEKQNQNFGSIVSYNPTQVLKMDQVLYIGIASPRPSIIRAPYGMAVAPNGFLARPFPAQFSLMNQTFFVYGGGLKNIEQYTLADTRIERLIQFPFILSELSALSLTAPVMRDSMILLSGGLISNKEGETQKTKSNSNFMLSTRAPSLIDYPSFIAPRAQHSIFITNTNTIIAVGGQDKGPVAEILSFSPDD